MSVSRHLDDLAQAVGFSSPCDWRDEHDRLELYRAALRGHAEDDALLDALRREPDDLVVSDVLAAGLAEVPASERRRWVEVSPASTRAFVRTRSREVALLREEGVAENDLGTFVDAVLAGSNWLQLGVATGSRRREVLRSLAERGRTRRIRRVAAERAARAEACGGRGATT